MRDLMHNLACTLCLSPSLVKANAQSQIVDRQGFDSVTFVAAIGKSADNPSAQLKVDIACELSDDKNTWAPVAARDIIGAAVGNAGLVFSCNDPSKTNITLPWGYCGPRRYLRANITVTGQWNEGLPLSLLALLGHAHQAPTVFNKGAAV
jgi:hypothetical protein